MKKMQLDIIELFKKARPDINERTTQLQQHLEQLSRRMMEKSFRKAATDR
jgi:hypothetical protein